MEKSIFQADYATFRAYLRARRRAAGLTQAQLAERLKQTQSFVSKCERGERRVDVVELRGFSRALDMTLAEFITGLETAIEATRHQTH